MSLASRELRENLFDRRISSADENERASGEDSRSRTLKSLGFLAQTPARLALFFLLFKGPLFGSLLALSVRGAYSSSSYSPLSFFSIISLPTFLPSLSLFTLCYSRQWDRSRRLLCFALLMFFGYPPGLGTRGGHEPVKTIWSSEISMPRFCTRICVYLL